MKKKKSIAYQLIKTKKCSNGYHSNYGRIDTGNTYKDGSILYRKNWSSYSQSSFKVLNTAFRALADFNKHIKCGCKAEIKEA